MDTLNRAENFIYDCSPKENMKARAEIAARIMAGVSHMYDNPTEAAKWSVLATDALIKELNAKH